MPTKRKLTEYSIINDSFKKEKRIRTLPPKEKILRRERSPRKPVTARGLLLMTESLNSQIEVLKSELIAKDQQIRYLGNLAGGCGVFEKTLMKGMALLGKIKTGGVKLFNFYNNPMTKEIIWEAIKEPLRLLVIAIIPILINWVSGQQWNQEVILMIVLAIRAIDKILHDLGKATGNDKLIGGITRF